MTNCCTKEAHDSLNLQSILAEITLYKFNISSGIKTTAYVYCLHKFVNFKTGAVVHDLVLSFRAKTKQIFFILNPRV